MRKSRLVSIISVLLIIVALVGSLFLDDVFGSRISEIVTIITALIGAIALYLQFKRDKEINQAGFLIEFSKHFEGTEGNNAIMSKLEKFRKGKDTFTAQDYEGIVSYLIWCETLASLVKRNVLSISVIDDLFSYRFFLITNNKYVQDNELVKECEFYVGIYTLHKNWTAYKNKNNSTILQNDTSLSATENYDKLNTSKK